ncbi:hypothetical protein niasHS_010018 [Heterodera schachtii]|uniref:Transcriptional repressor p66 coiled-coil MBD2-interaction domain-containing protein n=1 Tax=Heterodera schachtii TaxID=97005 RepID=A0ABD2IYF7_HETSC
MRRAIRQNKHLEKQGKREGDKAHEEESRNSAILSVLFCLTVRLWLLQKGFALFGLPSTDFFFAPRQGSPCPRKVSSATSIDYSDRNPIETPTKTTTDQKKTEDKSPRSQQQPNDDSDLTEQQQLSPNCPLRRSTRVSVLNAKKQTQQNERTESERSADSVTKDNDDELEMVQEHRTGGDAVAVSRDMEFNEHASTLSQQQCVSSLKRKLKRKLEDGQELDQYDCKFGIRLDPEGDVVMMSDESEISSLNEADVTDLRERYENTQRQEVPKEVMVQREMQIRELESILRLEEAKLMMLKKLQQSQQKAAQKTQQQQNQQQQQQQENVRRLAPGVVQNSTGQAYKPKVAVVNPSQHQTGNTSKTNGTTPQHGKKGSARSDTSVLQNGAGLGAALGGVANSGASIQLASLPPQHQQVIQQLYTRLSQNPPQLAQMIKTLPHSTGQALTELLRQYAVAQASNIQPAGSGQIQNSSAAAASAKFAQQLQSSVSSQAIAQAQIDAAHKQARELTQQKIASARQQLRKELDVMIMKLPAPKAPPPDLQFIPNGNQPDFCYLLGLDLTVQRVLKDKTMFRKADFSPYQCEECETDFTPSWKAICGEQEDYHLYCERCIRQAQKRKVRQDYSALLKRAFQQVQEREKEFERQVLAGKFNVEPVMPTPPTIAPTQQQTTTTTTSTGMKQQQHNIQTAVSTHCQPTSTPKGVPSSSAVSLQQFSQQHNSSAALNLSKSGAASANAMATVPSTAKGQHISSAQSAKSASAKRTSSTATTASSSSSATMANPLAALAQNPQLQQQFAAMASITNNPLFRQVLSNPMFAAAMTNNPMQLYAALAATQQQRTQQQQQQSAQNPANVSGAAAGNAMAALIQAVQQSVHQQQQQNRTSNASTVVTSNNSSSANPPAVSSSNTANSIAQQMQAMAAFASNPMLALQSQLSQMGAGGAANANVQLLSQLNNNPQLLRQFQQMYMAQQQMKAGTGGGKK